MQHQRNHSPRVATCIHLACAALVVAFCFSYRWPLSALGQEDVFIKAEDILLLGLLAFFYFRRRSTVRSPLDAPVAFFLLIVTASSLLGAWRGTLHNPIAGSLYFVKVVEYFFACYLVYYLTTDSNVTKHYVRALLFTAVAVSIYGLLEYQLRHPTRPFYFYRVFDRGYFQRDSNHMGAFLMFAASISVALTVWAKHLRARLLLLVGSGLMVTTLVLTYSRSAYAALGVAVFIILLARFKLRALPIMLCFALLLAFAAPQPLLERLGSFSELFHMEESSMSYRYQQIGRAWDAIVEYPLLGIGLGGRHRMFYENFYLLLVAETGLIGLGAFMWIVSRLYKCAIRLFQTANDVAVKGFAIGYIAGLTGLLLESMTMVTFIISRIAGPFWVATAILLILSKNEAGQGIPSTSETQALA